MRIIYSLFFIALFTCFSLVLFAQSERRAAGTLTNENVASEAWSPLTASTLSTSNDVYVSTASMGNGNSSDRLRLTNFGFTFPSNAVISGFEVVVERAEPSSNNVQDLDIRLIKSGTLTGTNKAVAGNWPNSDESITYGGQNDLWGATWLASDVLSPDFGLGIQVQRISPNGSPQPTPRLDSVSVIVYYSIPIPPLPVKLADVKASEIGGNVQIAWANMTETGVKNYEVEHSLNGQVFSSIGNLNPKSNNGGKVNYTLIDATPNDGVNFYRIKSIEESGKISYSSVMKVTIGNLKTEMIIYPNPVKNSQVVYQFTNLPKGHYYINIFNNIGQAVMSKQIDHQGGATTEVLQLSTVVKRGVYTLQIDNGTELKFNKTFLVQ